MANGWYIVQMANGWYIGPANRSLGATFPTQDTGGDAACAMAAEVAVDTVKCRGMGTGVGPGARVRRLVREDVV